jgi:hypothetical protein
VPRRTAACLLSLVQVAPGREVVHDLTGRKRGPGEREERSGLGRTGACMPCECASARLHSFVQAVASMHTNTMSAAKGLTGRSMAQHVSTGGRPSGMQLRHFPDEDHSRAHLSITANGVAR